MSFCSGFPKFKTKLYTDTLLSQVDHRKTENSGENTTMEMKHNKGNTFTKNKIQILNSSPLATLIQEVCMGRHLSVFRCTHNHSRAKFKLFELLERITYMWGQAVA
jgi:hypothetical protein